MGRLPTISSSPSTVTDVVEKPHWTASIDVGGHPASWLPAGIGDFNHDATSDFAWVNSTSGDLDI
jgi:hypothetical protein